MYHTVVICDFDDTIAYSKIGDTEPCEQLQQQKSSATDLIRQLVECKQKHSLKLVIMTNAEAGWVEICCNMYYPTIAPYLSHFEIISARSQYETFFPDNPFMWKYSACQALITKECKQVICMGDQDTDRAAVRSACESCSSIVQCCKSIKLKDRPSLYELIAQQNYLREHWPVIVAHNQPLDVQINIPVLTHHVT